MSFDDFQTLARLYVVGALDEHEMASFEAGRQEHGAAAEDYLKECRHLASAFALSLQPRPPAAESRKKLLSLIRENDQGRRGWFR